MVLVFAGPNDSGKSTIKQYFEIVCEYINADDVVESTGISNMDAAELVDKLRYEAINEKKIFLLKGLLNESFCIVQLHIY